MTSILLLITCVGVTWLCVWARAQDDGGHRGWSPFDIRDDGPDPASIPRDPPRGTVARGGLSQPIRNHVSERPWKRRSGF